MHQVVRSLAGLWRCLNPDCGVLLPPDSTRCRTCEALDIAAGELPDVRRGVLDEPGAAARARRASSGCEPSRPSEATPVVFAASPEELADPIDEDEDSGRVVWDVTTACPWCGAFSASGGDVSHLRACPHPYGAKAFRASTDEAHCPSCGDRGAQNRPILLPLKGSAAASTAVLTQGLSDELRHREGDAGGRLLVFADSRQNAAQQAGYADDQGARIAVRQLAVDALAAGHAGDERPRAARSRPTHRRRRDAASVARR